MGFLLAIVIELVLLYFFSRMLTKALSQFFYLVTKSQKVSVYLLALLFFPGTLLHEVAHYVMATILMVPTGSMYLLPKVEGHNVKLGSVEIAKTDPIRRMLIGVAPFLFGATILICMLLYSNAEEVFSNTWLLTLYGYIVFEIGNTMFSSKKDMEGTLELFLTVIILYTALYIIGFRIPALDFGSMLNRQIAAIAERIAQLLSIPLAIDVVIIVITRIINKVVR